MELNAAIKPLVKKKKKKKTLSLCLPEKRRAPLRRGGAAGEFDSRVGAFQDRWKIQNEIVFSVLHARRPLKRVVCE